MRNAARAALLVALALCSGHGAVAADATGDTTGFVRLRLPARAPFDASGVFAWLRVGHVLGRPRGRLELVGSIRRLRLVGLG